jgi:hypothetical protein
MRLLRYPLAALAMICSVLGACGSDKPAATLVNTSVAPPTLGDSGGDATQPAQGAGNLNCAILKTNLADILVNWQLVIGLTNAPASEWTNIPLGSLPKFGDQLAAVQTGLGGDANAAAALSYMSGANDIVARGLGGDSNAQADLTAYMGTDIAANVSKQLPISLAFQNAGCS